MNIEQDLTDKEVLNFKRRTRLSNSHVVKIKKDIISKFTLWLYTEKYDREFINKVEKALITYSIQDLGVEVFQ